MRLGIIGSPQSGKTTIFNAATGLQEAVGDFSQSIHRALVSVPDERLGELAELVNPKKITAAQIEFYDAPGLSGKGKDSAAVEISDDMRQIEAFIMVVDAFSPDATPSRDIEALTDEIILLDHVLIENIISKRLRKMKLTGDKSAQELMDLLKRCMEFLETGQPLIESGLSDDELKTVRGYQLLTLKPILVVLNISESDIPRAAEIFAENEALVKPGLCELAVVCGSIEMELVSLEEEERTEFMSDLQIETPATELVIKKAYALLGLISYLTAAEPEVRAWTIRRGDTARQAAGVIHSDIERGFIRAEVTAYDDYVRLKTMVAIKAAGKQRLEGKEYIVADGDVILFRFNV